MRAIAGAIESLFAKPNPVLSDAKTVRAHMSRRAYASAPTIDVLKGALMRVT